MSTVHRYFFWIEDEELEIYKNRKLIQYKGEKKYNYTNGIESFFEVWKENSAYEDGDKIDFVFIGMNQEKIGEFLSFCKRFPLEKDGEFCFEDLKSILDEKKLKRFSVEVGNNEYYFEKTEFNYNKISKDDNLEKIYILGENIKDKLFFNELGTMEIEKKSKNESELASFFRRRLED